MRQYSQKNYTSLTGGPTAGPAGLIGRVIAFIVGMGAFVVSLFVGAVFIAAIVGFVLLVGIGLAVRVWWIRRRMERYAREHGDLEAEYTVVSTPRHRDEG